MSFNPKIPIQKTETGKNDWWEVTKKTKVRHPVKPYEIKAGYLTDLISSPWVFYPFIHPHGAGSNEAILHDWEHDNNYLQDELGSQHARHLSNLLFAARMTAARAPLWKIWVMLLYVTALSWITWNKPKRTDEEPI